MILIKNYLANFTVDNRLPLPRACNFLTTTTKLNVVTDRKEFIKQEGPSLAGLPALPFHMQAGDVHIPVFSATNQYV